MTRYHYYRDTSEGESWFWRFPVGGDRGLVFSPDGDEYLSCLRDDILQRSTQVNPITGSDIPDRIIAPDDEENGLHEDLWNDLEPTTPRGGVLEEAHDLIHGERNAHYGSPTENFERTAALWNAQLGHKLAEGYEFTAHDVAMLMVQLKMARLVTSPGKRDHYVDAAGYLACGWECQAAEYAKLPKPSGES